jgi:hypothetical protein
LKGNGGGRAAGDGKEAFLVVDDKRGEIAEEE